jgi:hypothetical protein
MLPVILGLLGAAAPFIMDHINAERARIAGEAAHREAELNAAKEIFSNVNTGMDKLGSLSKSTMFAVIFRDLNTSTVGDPPVPAPNGMLVPGTRPQPTSKGPTGEDVATYWSYRSVLMHWQTAASTNFAQVVSYFGEESGNTFKQIQDDLETLAKQVDSAFYKRPESTDFIGDFAVNNIVPPDAANDFRTKYFGIWNAMEQRITVLSQDMIKAIQNETVGSLGLPETNEAQEKLKQLSPPEKN